MSDDTEPQSQDVSAILANKDTRDRIAQMAATILAGLIGVIPSPSVNDATINSVVGTALRLNRRCMRLTQDEVNSGTLDD